MSFEISAFNMSLTLIASVTYPQGVIITQFADDTDPLDVPAITIGGAEMGLNGDLVTYATPAPIVVNLSLIPNSDDDVALRILLENNRVGAGKFGTFDIISLTRVMPDGRVSTLSQGKIISGPPLTAVASSGRQKSTVYGFAFENISGRG